MYLLIFEDGEIRRADIIQDGDLMSSDNGLLDIVDIRKPDEPRRYFDSTWYDVEAV